MRVTLGNEGLIFVEGHEKWWRGNSIVVMANRSARMKRHFLAALMMGTTVPALAGSLTSLSREYLPAISPPDTLYRSTGQASLSPTGIVLWENTLSGPGAPVGKTAGMFDTISGQVALTLQSGATSPLVTGLPFGVRIASIFNPLLNRSDGQMLLRVTISGSGVTSSNNQMIYVKQGATFGAVRRTGLTESLLDGAIPVAYSEIVQRDALPYAMRYTLKTGSGSPKVTAGTDSGLMFVSPTGVLTNLGTREGGAALGGGIYGQFGRAASVGFGSTNVIAKWIAPGVGQTAKDALFIIGPSSSRAAVLQGTVAGGVSAGEKYGTFTGVTSILPFGLVRATLTGSATASNEGVWKHDGSLLLRKGDTITGGLRVARIVRVWGTNASNLIFHAIVTGTGVTASNNQVLVVRTLALSDVLLARTGDPVPGLSGATLSTFQGIDVEPVLGNYVILASLRGTSASANQVMLTGETVPAITAPSPELVKGQRYSTLHTPLATLKGISIKPTVDPSGVGGRGLAQIINDDGEVVVVLTWLDGVRELVKFTP